MDSAIQIQFDRCELEGLCRSDVAGLRLKSIKGSKHMYAQYHPTWQLVVKRQPYFVKPNMEEPFLEEAFNFTKVKKSEVLAHLHVKDGEVAFIDNDADSVDGTVYTVLLNVSPICSNHHLLVPNLKSCYNQVWRYDLTRELLSICKKSERDDYVLFFNSLGGFASVNHLHFQVMYSSCFYKETNGQLDLPHHEDFSMNKLPLEYEQSRLLCRKGRIVISELPDWLCHTIRLSVDVGGSDCSLTNVIEEQLCEYYNELIRMCYEYSFPYDVVFCQHGYDIYVFIRQYQQPLDDLKVNVLPACVELTGIVVYRSEDTFDNANEDILMKRCRETVCFESSVWDGFVQSFVNRIVNKQ